MEKRKPIYSKSKIRKRGGPPIVLAGKNDPDEKEEEKKNSRDRSGMYATNEEAKKDPDGSHKVFDITYHNPGHDDHGKVVATHSTMNLATAAIKKSKGPVLFRQARYRAVVRHVDNSDNDQRNKENEFRHRELAVKEKLASKKKLKETIERVINEK